MSVPHVRVAVVGAGFSGLGMATRLAERGEERYVVLERAADVGGTWRDNRYPGCACDVPSRLYSFSFRQNPYWTRDFAEASEIWRYLRDCADQHGIRDHLELGADLAAAAWDEGLRRWTLTLADGRQWTADAVVLGVGALHQPALPDIEGLSDFGGRLIHTADWPERDGLGGARVAVIGTGASAVQVVPELARRVARLHVFQRTPAWVLPKQDRLWSARRQRAFAAVPALQRIVRWGTYLQLESRVLAFSRFPQAMRVVEAVSRRHLARSVADPELQRRLTPDYTIGCKRILVSNDYWPAFERENVELVTDPIVRVEPDAVITHGGARHKVDAIVLGTGFTVTGSFDRMEITGRGGLRLADAWSEGMRSNLGVTVAGFPELYILLGPNTGLGHSSVILMIEAATGYVLRCLDRSVAIPHVTTRVAQERFAAEMAARSRRTVWASGCRSWYLDQFGRNSFLWPGSTASYWWRTRRVRADAFEPAAGPGPGLAAGEQGVAQPTWAPASSRLALARAEAVAWVVAASSWARHHA